MAAVYQVVLMAVLCAVGYLCYRFKLISEEGNRSLSAVVVNIANPAIIIHAFITTEYDPTRTGLLAASAILSVFGIVVPILLGKLLFRAPRDTRDVSAEASARRTSMERVCAVYTNSSFLGIPLSHGIFGSDGVFALAAYIAVFNIFMWTYGEMSVSGQSAGMRQTLLKFIKTPSLIAVIIGVVCFFARVRFPHIASDVVEYLGNLTTPLAMLVAGVMLAQVDFSALLRRKRLYYFSFVKLLLLPAVMLGIFYLCAVSGILPRVAGSLYYGSLAAGVNILSAACPTATICVILAVRYEKEPLYVTEIFAITTLFSVITIPALMKLFDVAFKFA